MSSSFATLNIGASALFASQRAVEVAAHNVANAGTDGFTRQRLAVQTAMPTRGTEGLRGDGMRGMGVTVLSVDRLRDRLADVAYRSEAGVAGAASARAASLSRVESILGPYAEGHPEAFSRFLASWDRLNQTPTDPAARASVLANGAALAQSLAGSAAGLGDVAREIALRVGDQVAEVNGLTTQLAKLNEQIQDAFVSGSVPNDLLDQRDSAIDRLTYLTGARTVQGQGSTIDLVLGAEPGTPLVRGETAFPLAVEGDPMGVTVDGVPVAATGQIGGYLSIVNADLPAFEEQLDTIARGLRDAVNEVQARGFDLDGTEGGAFFTGTGAGDLRVSPELTERGIAASASGKSEDGNNALAMRARMTQPAVDGATVAEALRAYGGRLGQAVADSRRGASTAELGLTGATLARASSNGVNVDEEMVDLVKHQHAYSAASRVITVVDGMLDKIINEMGR